MVLPPRRLERENRNVAIGASVVQAP